LLLTLFAASHSRPQALVEEQLMEATGCDWAEEVLWADLIRELAGAAAVRDHEDERSFIVGLRFAVQGLAEAVVEVEVRRGGKR